MLPSKSSTTLSELVGNAENSDTDAIYTINMFLLLGLLSQKDLPKITAFVFPGSSDGKATACNAEDLGWEDPLEKEILTHSSTLAWKIPWTEEPSGLRFMGWQRIGHD